MVCNYCSGITFLRNFAWLRDPKNVTQKNKNPTIAPAAVVIVSGGLYIKKNTVLKNAKILVSKCKKNGVKKCKQFTVKNWCKKIKNFALKN